MRARPILLTSALVALLATGCSGGGEPVPTDTAVATTSDAPTTAPTTTPPTTSAASVDLGPRLSESIGATSALVQERGGCAPAGEDLTCIIEVTSRMAELGRADIAEIEGLMPQDPRACMQEAGRAWIAVLQLYVDQDTLYTAAGDGPYPLIELQASQDAVDPALQEYAAAIEGC